jgi:hypothetical protein
LPKSWPANNRSQPNIQRTNMPSQFRKRIQTSLDNPALQSALDHNAERRRNARVTANASLPEDLNTCASEPALRE